MKLTRFHGLEWAAGYGRHVSFHFRCATPFGPCTVTRQPAAPRPIRRHASPGRAVAQIAARGGPPCTCLEADQIDRPPATRTRLSEARMLGKFMTETAANTAHASRRGSSMAVIRRSSDVGRSRPGFTTPARHRHSKSVRRPGCAGRSAAANAPMLHQRIRANIGVPSWSSVISLFCRPILDAGLSPACSA